MVAPIPHVEFVSLRPKDPPMGVFYSTKPLVGMTAKGSEYVVKGPEPEVVVPEALERRSA